MLSSCFPTTAYLLAACSYMAVFVLISRGQPDMFGVKTLVMSSPIPAQPKLDLRINQIQVIGSHNSYHREMNSTEKEAVERMDLGVDLPSIYYSHASVSDQLDYQSVRSLEFDVWSDYEHGGLFENPHCQNVTFLSNPEMKQKGAKVFHMANLDVRTVCHTIVGCLTQVREWSNANSHHVPILIDIEFKEQPIKRICDEDVEYEQWTASHLDSLDAEIRSVFPASQMIIPDDLRRDDLTLEQSVLSHGWPTLEESRGKVLFFMDNEADGTNNIREAYRSDGRDNLEGRIIFTNSRPGEPDAAFLKRNDPFGGEEPGTTSAERNDELDEYFTPIRDLVAKGYLVRTRADADLQEVKSGNTTRREVALGSGAQIVSTDSEWPGMSARWDSDYVARLPGGSVARCNPVNARSHCRDDDLE